MTPFFFLRRGTRDTGRRALVLCACASAMCGCAVTRLEVTLPNDVVINYYSGKDVDAAVIEHPDGRVEYRFSSLASPVWAEQRLFVSSIVEAAVMGAVKGAAPTP